MRKVLVSFLIAILLVVVPAVAYETPVNLVVVKPDGTPASNADYKVYYTNGTLAVSGVLNADGKASFNLTDNTAYIITVTTASETILSNFTITIPANQTPVNITINATKMYALNVSTALTTAVWGVSPPSVEVKLVPEAFPNFNYTFRTNWTIYTLLRNNLTFPNETKAGIWTFVLKNVTVNGNRYTNVTTVTIPMSGNTNVIIYYELKYPVLQPFYILLIAGLIGIALVAVIIISGKKAKAMVRSKIENNFKFYRRVR